SSPRPGLSAFVPFTTALAGARGFRRRVMLKLGVVGYGYWGPNIVRNFANQAGCEVVMVCDKSPKAIAQVRRRHPGVHTTDNPDDVTTSPGIDAVAIVTPVSTHYELA